MTPRLEDLRRELAADPRNPCLEREVSRAEMKAGVRGSLRLMALSTSGYETPPGYSRRLERAWHIARAIIIRRDPDPYNNRNWHYTYCGRLMIGKHEPWSPDRLPLEFGELGSGRWNHRAREKFADPNEATCKQCRRAVGLPPKEAS